MEVGEEAAEEDGLLDVFLTKVRAGWLGFFFGERIFGRVRGIRERRGEGVGERT